MQIDWLGWLLTGAGFLVVGFGVNAIGSLGRALMDLLLKTTHREFAQRHDILVGLLGFAFILLTVVVAGAAVTWMVNGIAALTASLKLGFYTQSVHIAWTTHPTQEGTSVGTYQRATFLLTDSTPVSVPGHRPGTDRRSATR